MQAVNEKQAHGGLLGLALGLSLVALAARAEERPRSFEQALIQARIALKTRNLSLAEERCQQALAAADEPWYGGLRSVEAARACADVAVEKSGPGAALRHFRDAAHLSVHDFATRRALMLERRRAAENLESPAELELVAALSGADAAVQDGLNRPDRAGLGLDGLLAELEGAEAVYQRDRDRAFGLLARAARALMMARSRRAADALPLTEGLVGADQPPAVRLAALEALYLGRVGARDVEGAAVAAIRLNALRAAEVDLAERPYFRSLELEAGCALYDASHGRGACARLELEVTGAATLRDFARLIRPTLNRDELELIHRQAFPALEACVHEAARADGETYRGAELEVSWTIGRDGAAHDAKVRPERFREALWPCVERTVLKLRYPRSARGEPMPVRVPYRFE
jgi:hypothetical protein